MRIQSDIDIDVAVHYLDIEDLRFPQNSRDDSPEVQWDRIRATQTVDGQGGTGHIYVTGAGYRIKKDGTPGLQQARIQFGSGVLRRMPEEWQQRITNDLAALAAKVSVSE